ncbi:LysR family transcriptional regulator [Bacillus norwichensis]|uniref:LysR family transcriptional regulator n=1 Tax=Bacillus norwichensis TaxID=2762217 RepID=A0ABR8VNZ6_9BACI|nr:LysR family transcriptional regulator [Bacillus norwichensis]MBD8006477.1 LysR family transcriptional regulator [Bacillus norwichensis]
MLEKLKSFVVLSESESFTEAAKRLYCSQPTISNHIHQLEQHFKTTLINRTGKAVKLTKQGEALLQYAKEMNGLIEKAEHHIRQLEEGDVLSIYMSNYIARYYFSNQYTQLHHLSPSSKLNINICCYSELKRSFQEKKANFAIMPIYPEDKEIVQQCSISYLFEDEFVLVFPPSHDWHSRKIIYPRDLQSETLLVPQSLFLKRLIIQSLYEKNIQLRYSQMGDFEMIKMSVKAGLGIAFLPYTAVAQEIRKGELCTLPVSSINIKRQNGLVIQNNVDLTKSEHLFCQNIMTSLAADTI